MIDFTLKRICYYYTIAVDILEGPDVIVSAEYPISYLIKHLARGKDYWDCYCDRQT